MKRVAIVGSGIAGISASYFLNSLGYDVHLFEEADYYGGHTNTIDICVDEKKFAIDTGFLVHNDRTYPNLIPFFKELDVPIYPSDMSFSVQNRRDHMMWAGTSLTSLFAQKKNIFSFKFYKFIGEILRFNNQAQQLLDHSRRNLDLTLKELLDQYGYSENFRRWYLLPMGGCIWSTPVEEMLQFPAHTFMVFCMNHGLLQILKRPQWKTVQGGCRQYVDKALGHIENKFLNSPVTKVESQGHKVLVTSKGKEEEFDYCIFCTHPPEANKIDIHAPDKTKNILSAFQYQPNVAVVHTDTSVLPSKKSAWASWNYLSSRDEGAAVSVSYLLNMLQPLPVTTPVIVTLNPQTLIKEDLKLRQINYAHPLLSVDAIKAQDQVKKIQGERQIFYAGAWMRYGFHEDGILSSKWAINSLLERDGREQRLVIL